MKKNTFKFDLFIFSFLILFFIIWKTNSYIINGVEEIFIKDLINIDILSPEYEFFFQGNEEDRKYFRRYNIYFFSYLYEITNQIIIHFNINFKFIIYFYYSIISFSLAGGIFFTIKCVQKVCNENQYIIWIYVMSTTTYILVVGKINDGFSHFEFFLISGCLYFSMNKQKYLFVLLSFFAILNRETGILSFFIYFILNEKSYKNIFVSFTPIIIFLLINLNFFLDYPYNFNKIMFVTSDISRVNLINIFHLDIIKFIGYLFYTLIIYCPLIYCLKNYKIFINKQHSSLFFLFLIILNFGTFIGNIYPQLVIIPFMSIIFFGKKLIN
mgnify:CR=1 FL=1